MIAASRLEQIEHLLARHIGPFAKIVLARARKSAKTDGELLAALSQSIDSETDRAAFLTAAAQITAGGSGAELIGAQPPQPAADPPDSASTSARAVSAPAAAPVTPPRGAPVSTSASPAAPPPHTPRPAADADAMRPGAIFISYARDNLPAAERIAEALRGAGLDVWFDRGKLQPGDMWDLKIRRNIDACSFFLPLVSRETDGRQEGYFRREWNLAADRALNFSEEVTFIVPVTIDDTPAYTARVPERFRRAHWVSLPQGEVTDEFVESMVQLVTDYRLRTSR